MKNIIIILLGLSFNHFAWAGKGDGGGAGFKVGDKYITWDRAGIRLKDQERGYDLDPETINGVKEFTDGLPYSEAWFSIAIGREDHFKLAEKVGRTLKNRIRDEYALCFDDKEFKKKRGKFTIFAVSRSDETFLLPEFFELDPVSRAKVLIHEAHVRDHGFSCDTLRLDEQLSLAYEISQGNESLSELKLTLINREAMTLSYRVNFQQFNHLFDSLKNAVLADFYNRGLELPVYLILDEENIRLYFDKANLSMRQVAKFTAQGHHHKWTRMDRLKASSLPPELFDILTQLTGTRTTFPPGKRGEVEIAAKKSQKMQALCENHGKEMFIFKTQGDDPWGLDIELFLTQCVERDGVRFALPKLWLRSMSYDYDR